MELRKVSVLAAISAGLLSSAPGAADFSYDFISLSYHDIEETATTYYYLNDLPGDDWVVRYDGKAKGSALSIHASKLINETVYVDAEWRLRRVDFDGFRQDVSDTVGRLGIGVGMRFGTGADTDVLTRVGYIRSARAIDTYGVTFDSVTKNGYVASVGLRTRLSSRVEFFGDIGYEDVYESGTLSEVGLRYRFSDHVSAKLENVNDSEMEGFGIGLRYAF